MLQTNLFVHLILKITVTFCLIDHAAKMRKSIGMLLGRCSIPSHNASSGSVGSHRPVPWGRWHHCLRVRGLGVIYMVASVSDSVVGIGGDLRTYGVGFVFKSFPVLGSTLYLGLTFMYIYVCWEILDGGVAVHLFEGLLQVFVQPRVYQAANFCDPVALRCTHPRVKSSILFTKESHGLTNFISTALLNTLPPFCSRRWICCVPCWWCWAGGEGQRGYFCAIKISVGPIQPFRRKRSFLHANTIDCQIRFRGF